MTEIVVITDTSCLILLDNISSLHLLHDVYPTILTTPEVAKEFKKELPVWITITPANNKALVNLYKEQVDLGEASAIALAQEVDNALLVVDDLKGRRLAAQLSLKYTGTIGILIAARQKNSIASLRPYFDAINRTNFRIDPNLLERILSDFKD